MQCKDIVHRVREYSNRVVDTTMGIRWEDSNELAPNIRHYLPAKGVGVLSRDHHIEELDRSIEISCYVSCTRLGRKPEIVYDILYTANHKAENKASCYELLDAILEHPQDFALPSNFSVSSIKQDIIKLKLQEATMGLRLKVNELINMVGSNYADRRAK